MPTIRIDDDVYSWLKNQAIPFEDTPNSVLRRLAGLDKDSDAPVKTIAAKKGVADIMHTTTTTDPKHLTAKYLMKLWNVDAIQAYYHQDGKWFENLVEFPGALFDPNGYVLFKTEQAYKNCSYLNIGRKLNVRDGISSIPSYRRMK